jgi:hypothetical protein
MRYMLLIYTDEKATAGRPESQSAAKNQEWGAYAAAMREAGKMQAGDPLTPVATATTVRLQNGAAVMTDGPFAETKEQLGGYFIVDAANLDDALAWARKMPNLSDGGCVEVRPIPTMG